MNNQDISKRHAKYIKYAKEKGATNVKIVPYDKVVFKSWVRLKCRFGCTMYGKNLTCPPYVPSIEEFQKMFSDYKYAMIVNRTSDVKTIDYREEFIKTSKLLYKIEKMIFNDGQIQAFSLNCGTCYLCAPKPCTLTTCRYPDKARPSAEACGIDLLETAKNAGMEISFPVTDKMNLYGIVLF